MSQYELVNLQTIKSTTTGLHIASSKLEIELRTLKKDDFNKIIIM
jgi:hypothetical protein